jgi:hypothetical protein
MRWVLYVGGWTAFCLLSLYLMRDNWFFWPLGVVVVGFIWLVGIPIALLRAVERMTDSLPDDDETLR